MLAVFEVRVVGTDWIALATGVATFLAVVAALAGPYLYDRRRSPKLTLSLPNGGRPKMARSNERWIGLMEVEIENALHRAQAENVQVFLTIGRWADQHSLLLPSERAPVPFRHREGGVSMDQFQWRFQRATDASFNLLDSTGEPSSWEVRSIRNAPMASGPWPWTSWALTSTPNVIEA